MTTKELQKILNNKNLKITPAEFCEMLYQLKDDCVHGFAMTNNRREQTWYQGEMNGFQIALDLAEHLSEIVRCKDCKNWKYDGTMMDENNNEISYGFCRGCLSNEKHFCSNGERK